MLDLVFSGRNMFMLYIVIAGRFLDPLIPCHSVRLFEGSQILRHVLGFLTLIFFAVVADTELDGYMPLGTVLASSAIIYFWFLISSRMTALWWIGLVLLLAAVYLISLYEERQQKEDPELAKTLDIVKTGAIGASLVLTLFGFLIYVGEKKLEYKNDFNYQTLLLGTAMCKDTPNKTPYWDSLKAAFMAKPWIAPMRGGGLETMASTLMANPDFVETTRASTLS